MLAPFILRLTQEGYQIRILQNPANQQFVAVELTSPSRIAQRANIREDQIKDEWIEGALKELYNNLALTQRLKIINGL